MLQTLALAAALSLAPAQPGTLTISNDRITFGGRYGYTRPNSNLMPGDVFFLAFDIENLQVDATGGVKYAMGMEVVDAAGKPVYSSPPGNIDDVLPLGGTKVPAFAFYALSPTQAAGPLTCKVTVTDRANGATQTVQKAFTVTSPAFGAVGLTLSHDMENELPAPFKLVAGPSVWLHFGVVGFARNPQNQQPDVVTELRILDQATGQPVTREPWVKQQNAGIPANALGLVFGYRLPLNRAGQFTVELKTTCRVSRKDYKLSFPLTVLDPTK